MSDLKVCEGLLISGANKNVLERMKKNSNTLESGAEAILEALDMFAEELVAKYEEEGTTVPYDKLFFALKQIIHSGSEKEEVRDAIMTGIINETGNGVPVARQPQKVVVKEVVKYVRSTNQTRNKSAITKFAKNHTISEIQNHFEFPSYNAAKCYIVRNKIPHKAMEKRKNQFAPDAERVRVLAREMRLCELYRTFNCTKDQMMYFCRTHNIVYRSR